MESGDSVRYMCDSCFIEFEVTLEPGQTGNPDIEGSEVTYCPFCGETNIAKGV